MRKKRRICILSRCLFVKGLKDFAVWAKRRLEILLLRIPYVKRETNQYTARMQTFNYYFTCTLQAANLHYIIQHILFKLRRNVILNNNSVSMSIF